MPRATFLNLPKTKRKAVFDAAVKEFSMYMYSDASINRIIKTAQIPRGSFYQYFVGKEDLFSYIIDQIFTEIEEIMQTRQADWQALDALSIFMQKVYATVELNKKKPEYVQITFLQSRDKTQFVRQFFEISETQKKVVLQLFERDKQRGIIRKDVDSSLIIDMVHILSKELFFDVGMDSEAYIKKIEAVIETIQKGIGRYAK